MALYFNMLNKQKHRLFKKIPKIVENGTSPLLGQIRWC